MMNTKLLWVLLVFCFLNAGCAAKTYRMSLRMPPSCGQGYVIGFVEGQLDLLDYETASESESGTIYSERS